MVQNDCGSKKLDGIIAISNYLKNYYKSCKNVVVIPRWLISAKKSGRWRQRTLERVLISFILVSRGKRQNW